MSAGETSGSDCEVKLQVKKRKKSWKTYEKQRKAADAALSKGHRGARIKCLDFCCQNAPNASNHLASKAYEPINLKVHIRGSFCISMCFLVNSWGRMGYFSRSNFLKVPCSSLTSILLGRLFFSFVFDVKSQPVHHLLLRGIKVIYDDKQDTLFQNLAS